MASPNNNAIMILTAMRVDIIVLSLLTVLHVAYGFAPSSSVATANSLITTTASATRSRRRHRRRHNSSNTSSSLFSNSREQVEQFLSESYPKFCSLLYQDPMALQQMRESNVGFTVFAMSDAAFYNALMPEQLQLLEAACNEPQLLEVVSTMAAYHMASVPIAGDIMASFQVVTTRVGELPVEVASDGSGALYVNGVRILQSYVFEDVIIQNYQDKDGNMIGSQAGEGGKRYIVHEVENLICPDELWQSLHSHFQSTLLF